jgi:hypothetical protein
MKTLFYVVWLAVLSSAQVTPGFAGAPADAPVVQSESVRALQSNLSATPVNLPRTPPAQKTLENFTILYEANYSAFKGTASLALTAAEKPNEYLYQVQSKASGIARLFQPGTATESSRFTLAADGLKPLQYAYDEGSGKTKGKSSVEFDWPQLTASSIHKGVPASLPLEQPIQDRLSADLQTILQLRAGESPTTQSIVYRNSIRHYDLFPRGQETVTTPAGTFAAVKYLRQREGSKRSTLIWFAPDAGYLPVRIEQLKNDKTTVTMTATSIVGPKQ